MSVETHLVLIGACGWKHKDWLNDFYSEDLPEEWQLGYYSNEFPVVYVRTNDWLDESYETVSDMAEWTEDVTDSFRFILEVPAKILCDEKLFASALNQAKDLGKFCLGLVFQLSHNVCSDILLLEKCITKAQMVSSVCVDKCDISLTTEIKGLLFKSNVNQVWNGKSHHEESIDSSSLAISYVSGDNLDMVALRKVIEVCLSVSDENRISVLCIDGDPPSLEVLRNADTIVNLL